MTIAVVGVGGVAGYFTAQLLAAGHDPVCCVRRPFQELVVHTDAGRGPVLRSQPRVVTDPADFTDTATGSDQAVALPAAWVFVGVKAHDTAGAADWLANLCGPDTVVVALQNGPEAADRLAPLVNGATVLPAVVYCGAELVAPGVVEHRQHHRLVVPACAAADHLAELFTGTPVEVARSDDWLSDAWQKLCANAIANGVTALTARRSSVFAEPEGPRLAEAIGGEVIAVAAAQGIHVDAGLPGLVARVLASSPPGSGTSMLYDRLAGRQLESDAIYGAVVRAGGDHGVPTPVCGLLADLCALAGPVSPSSGHEIPPAADNPRSVK
jgi:2-dehydropantoate 2-reductase